MPTEERTRAYAHAVWSETVRLSARVVESSADRATVEATLSSAGVVTATCRGTFVAVREGHPAYHRW